ncbi:GH92 family glycosyl hydrolase [Sphingobacterium haloxyli]|uniref:Alpha-mannosidase n=1 Tax=Sphingobacterium haloxyli TaxID=2100533 RepID=A0A2S9J2E1_9SPHI|nr:GH92 family glycosyl hydrolase [Sphingobacterium haloxyli]PRD46945.1 alpha-mannosidase [Sphingobacterium haloxyli]
MRKSVYWGLAIFYFCIASANAALSPESRPHRNPVDWVNPLMGTDSKYSLSNGNTYPAIALPWGMNFWTPQTGKMGNGWIYTYSADQIRGIKQTHQPSPWMNDYGQFSLMPVTGKLKFREDDRASWFNHKSEKATPYYYSVYLADYEVLTEVTPTERAAMFRFTFPETDSAFIVIDAMDKGSFVHIIDDRTVIGYSSKNSGGVPANFKNYFVISFDTPITFTATFDGEELHKGRVAMEGEHAGAVIGFRTDHKQVVSAKVASSFISIEQAWTNLRSEIGEDNFDGIKSTAYDRWNDVLGKFSVGSGNVDQVRTFYSCLYRSVLFPRKFYEYDKDGAVMHYSPYNGKVLPGYMFTDTGFWDTFRSLFPLLNLVYPEVAEHMQNGLVNAYQESGWLPEWASPGLRDIMIGNNSVSVVTDGYLKLGEKADYDIHTLYEAAEKVLNNPGPLTAVGRAGAEHYHQLGYIPSDSNLRGSVARTLEYAYNDFTMMQLAKLLNKPDEVIRHYRQRSLNYRNVFDKETNLVRGRKSDGTFDSPFDPFDWGGNTFTEGNAWHWTWSVFHDIEGLKQLMGGERDFLQQLDTIFNLSTRFGLGGRNNPIHEMREMQVVNMGQYAHGNQPIQHMIYLYGYTAEPWKGQYWVRETMDRLYHAGPDGYCGDEDNGQTSAWYVFSALGFYPVCPGTDQYVLGSPLFEEITIELPDEKVLRIDAPHNNADTRYVDEVCWNGQSYSKMYVTHQQLLEGGVLQFNVADKPNKERKPTVKDYPYSLSLE